MTKFAIALPVIIAGLLLATAVVADPLPGERVFKSQCGACHTVDKGKNRVGPSLFGIVGRESGKVEGFRYSAANSAAKLTWTTEVLDKYLTNPKEVVPGTTMTYAGLKNEQQRKDLIAFLGEQK